VELVIHPDPVDRGEPAFRGDRGIGFGVHRGVCMVPIA
jgi:hypothetical protein